MFFETFDGLFVKIELHAVASKPDVILELFLGSVGVTFGGDLFFRIVFLGGFIEELLSMVFDAFWLRTLLEDCLLLVLRELCDSLLLFRKSLSIFFLYFSIEDEILRPLDISLLQRTFLGSFIAGFIKSIQFCY